MSQRKEIPEYAGGGRGGGVPSGCNRSIYDYFRLGLL